MSVIEADLRIHVDGRDLLPHTVMRVEPGSITALVGPSGSGKTTLLRALVGDAAPQALIDGSLTVAGINPFEVSTRERAAFRRSTVAFVGQDPGAELPPLMRVRSMLTELAPGADVVGLLRRVGLGSECARKRVHQLSGGQQRRVALARALSRQPTVLALDEPFAGLDQDAAEQIKDVLVALARSGVAIVFTGHYVERVATLADVIIEMASETETQGTTSAVSREAGTTLLRARGLGYTTATGLELFRDISFDVYEGEFLGVVGPSGSGKSTLLRCLMGTDLHGVGEVECAGERREAGRPWSRHTYTAVQLISQDPASALNPKLSAVDAVARAVRESRELRLGRNAARTEALKLLASVGLGEDIASRRPDGLSGGQRQRVSIARALAVRPKVLLCDEITSALDQAAAEVVMGVLEALSTQGLGIVFVSHELELVERYCAGVVKI